MRSARRCSNLPRSEAFILLQGPASKARRAARTALSTSEAPAAATWQIFSPVDGFQVANVWPDSPSVQRLSMRSFVAETGTGMMLADDSTEGIADSLWE